MSDPTLPTFDPIAYIRTYVPVLVGSILAYLIAHITFVAAAVAFVDKQFGQSWRDLLVAAATAAVIALYYYAARQVGKRWPGAEKWLLGSSAVPTYTAR